MCADQPAVRADVNIDTTQVADAVKAIRLPENFDTRQALNAIASAIQNIEPEIEINIGTEGLISALKENTDALKSLEEAVRRTKKFRISEVGRSGEIG